jgi:hypothetical protein
MNPYLQGRPAGDRKQAPQGIDQGRLFDIEDGKLYTCGRPTERQY